jgi:predicted DNA-binding protein
MVKVTFTLDDETVAAIRRLAERTRRPQSQVVREAVAEYAARGERLTEEERSRALDAFDTLAPRIPPRARADVPRELRELRAARRRGGRRSPSQ